MYRSIRKFSVGDKTYFPGDPAVNDLPKKELEKQIKLNNIIQVPDRKKKVKENG